MLIVNHRFFPAEGGTERWALGLARALKRKGVGVTVLAQSETGTHRVDTVEGIDVVRIPVDRVGGFRIPSRYWRTLRSLDYDLMHMSGNRIWCADFYLPVAGVFGGPQVITPHDFYQLAMNPQSAVNRLYFGWYFPACLRPFQRYLALTAAERDRISRFGYPGGLVDVVGEGIDVSEFQQEQDDADIRTKWGITKPLVALYVGGTWENKRVDRLVRGLSNVKDKVSLLVVGSDVAGSRYDQASITRLAGDLKVEVRFTGQLPRRDIVSVYRGSDVFVLGSQYEGFGISLLEAIASGLPFVSFDVGAARQLAASGAGYAVSGEPEFAERLKGLVDNPSLREEMGTKALMASAEWDWKPVSERYLRSYGEAVKACNGTG